MKKKKNIIHNTSGITVCDSIVMSVKDKHMDMRKIESVLIAVAGYVSVLMVFLTMFDFRYNKPAVVMSAVIFSFVYICLSLIGKNALWLIVVTIAAGFAAAFRIIDSAAAGYKYVYNVIYKASYHTDIEYYKFLDTSLEYESTTAFFILCVWLIALIIYIFTVYHQHPLPPLIVVFPILEIGMYNGLKVPVLWGMMAIGYLLAEFAMCTIDIGEYYGGNGGFVRKDDLFFPKRQMKLKVTEKCGLYIVVLTLAVAGLATLGIKITGYKRSDELNQKRIDIRDAVNSFSIEHLADSISDITAAFGFTFRIESHKLGNVSSMKYKDITDMTVKFDSAVNGAVYLKEYTGSVYRNNEWFSLPDDAYKDEIFTSFETYGIYPQNFPFRFNKLINPETPEHTIWIDSLLKGERSFAPYGSDSTGILGYNNDSDMTSKKRLKDEYSYTFSHVSAENTCVSLIPPVRNVYTLDNIEDEDMREMILEYGNEKGLVSYDSYLSLDSEIPANINEMYNEPSLILAELVQEDYEKFVYDNYLQIPDDTNIAEVREAFADIFDTSEAGDNAVKKIEILTALRNRVSEMAEYSLQPGRTPKNRDFINYFLLENHKGYCTHYATSGVILSRMAGIPARYATGYVVVGDDFSSDNRNDDGTYTIDVKDNRSHAWIEVYLNGYGWVPFEFTAGYTEQTIDTTPTTSVTTVITETETTAVENSGTESADTTDRPNNTTVQQSGHQQNTTSVTSNAAAFTTGGHMTGAGGGFEVPESVKNAVYYIIIAVCAAAVIVLRRRIMIAFRKKRFTEGSAAKRAEYMFKYVERIFAYVNIKRDEMQLTEFAEYVESCMGGRYFSEGEFSEFMNTALYAAFSGNSPSDDELGRCMKFADQTAKKIYEKSNVLGKLYLKIILCYI
ncbi:MAG: transglutaminase-like domain-containing protein [Ruminococcus sp.]|nr:transglutaminase-like domain-containing protein [Ruminococcus sp.]MDE6784618.1 transglutaminase-like domain-containing protein [Ruminococcus sp.]